MSERYCEIFLISVIQIQTSYVKKDNRTHAVQTMERVNANVGPMTNAVVILLNATSNQSHHLCVKHVILVFVRSHYHIAFLKICQMQVHVNAEVQQLAELPIKPVIHVPQTMQLEPACVEKILYVQEEV